MTLTTRYKCTKCQSVDIVTHESDEKLPAAITCRLTAWCMGTALRETKIDAARRLVGRHQHSFDKLSE